MKGIEALPLRVDQIGYMLKTGFQHLVGVEQVAVTCALGLDRLKGRCEVGEGHG